MEENRQNSAPREIVYNIQIMLQTVGREDAASARLVPTGSYDTATASAVDAFQRRNDLPLTGEVDEDTFSVLLSQYVEAQERETQEQPLYPFRRQLEGGRVREGDRFDLVTMIQCMLETLSAADDRLEAQEITGVYDDRTRQNVILLQEICGLEPHGEVDRQTWDRMALLYNDALTDQT